VKHYPDIALGIPSGSVYTAYFSDIRSSFLSGIYSDVLSGMSSDILLAFIYLLYLRRFFVVEPGWEHSDPVLAVQVGGGRG
jgi:hypothetical protein